ncbi:MAG TPA: nitrate- and nitrite sensing domain-containing protein [Actinocrinis sp.]|uniref:sensor histidine kinase n=1 Tax=Actinocrinis sp. TaxID=1920516 RepID=UPI002DDD4D6B|nr:nitrate- and nitrite sensing domain-containing protein [Actinocrinis sp.]HEV2346749.1 nitrate- and nitrite sensing domain-containing protein [Actinocrinis sp.]
MQTRPVTPRREPAQPGPRASRPGAPERRRSTQSADPAPGRSADRPSKLSLRSWRVRNRLTLLVLLPLVVAMGFGSVRIDGLYSDESHYRDAHGAAQATGLVEAVLLTMQEERLDAAICLSVFQPCNMAAADRRAAMVPSQYMDAATAKSTLEGYVTAYKNAQTAVIKATNDVRAVGNAATSGNANISNLASLQSTTIEAFGRATDIAYLRQVAADSSVQASPVFRAYTSIIDDVVAVIGQTSSGTADPLVNQDNASLAAIDDVIEAQSVAQTYTQEVIANGELGGNGPNPDLVEAKIQATDLNQAIASQQSALNNFMTASPPSLVQSYQAAVSGTDITTSQAAVGRALAILQESTNFSASKNQFGTDVVDEALPATIGDLRTVQATAIQQLVTDSQTLLDNAQSSLYRNGSVILFALLLSVLGIALVARSLVGPLQVLRSGALDIAANRLPEVVRRLRDADSIDAEGSVDPIPITSNDEIGQVARAFDEVHLQAVRLASEQALLRSNVNSMFVNLSRRSQSLVQRQLRLIDELENSEQDPDQLANLFKLDHLATRMRRNGENLLVLAGEEPGRKWSQAVRLLDVMRAGASEVEQYERVALRDLPDVNVLGRVVNDLVHLVAELLENATSFSAPETKVSVTANMLNTGGVMLEIEDAGIGMTPEELDDANERLANPPVIDVAISRRMGLYVVGRLATRHGIQVRLRRSAGGGITALVLVPSTLLAGADGEQQAPTPELSATGARSLGALPRRGGGQGGFSDQADDLDGPAFPSESSGAPPYRGSAPSGLGGGSGGMSGSGLSNGDQFADLPSFGAPGRPSAGQDDLPRRPDPLPGLDGPGRGPGATPTIPGARTPFEDRSVGAGSAGFGSEQGMPDPDAAGRFPGSGSNRPGGDRDMPTGQFQAFAPPRDGGADRPDPRSSSGQFNMPGVGQRESRPDLADGPSAPRQDPASTGQFPRIQDPASTGQFPRVKDPGSTGGQMPRLPGPDSAPPFPGPAAPQSGSAPAPRPQDPASTGQFPRIQDPASTGQFPAVRPAEPQFPGTAAPSPAGPALFAPPPGSPTPASAAPQGQPQLPAMARPTGPNALDLPQAAQPGGAQSAVERLFAQDPLPPAPSTDERLPIFEAMESEWFRRRDEARAQAAMAQSNTVLPPLPTMPRPAAPGGGFPGGNGMAPTGTGSSSGVSSASAAPVIPVAAAPSTPPVAPAPVSASAPSPASAGTPVQPLAAASATTDSPAADSRGASPVENTGTWSSPGDEGWKAAQAAAKPVAAGLTQKGLPKRVPKSNLVPGSAGGVGAAKATPPVIPPRSADAVRGRLSSFHQGLRQGRDAASADPEPGDGAGQDRRDD